MRNITKMMSMMIPSALDNSPPIRQAKRRTAPHKRLKGKSVFSALFETGTGFKAAVMPSIAMTLNILEPTTLLTAREFSPASELVTETESSGRDVPMATTVSPMISPGTLNLFATQDAPSTKKSAPFMRSMKPKTNIRIFFNNSIIFVPCSRIQNAPFRYLKAHLFLQTPH